jgi:hypothetical protein
VLTFGILLALVMRGLFIALGAALLSLFSSDQAASTRSSGVEVIPRRDGTPQTAGSRLGRSSLSAAERLHRDRPSLRFQPVAGQPARRRETPG